MASPSRATILAVSITPAGRPDARPGSLAGSHTSIAACSLGLLTYLALYAYRFDYAAHFVAGFGLTLVAHAWLADRISRSRAPYLAVAVTAAVAIFGELTIFNNGFPDPIDVTNSITGATIAFACLACRDREAPQIAGLQVVGTVMVVLGFVIRYLL